MADDEYTLSSEALEEIQQVRTRIHDNVSAIVALGDGGWNHGAKMMRAHAEAVFALKQAEATLAESAEQQE